MAPIAKAHRCSPGRISLAWRLAEPVETSVVIGAKRLDQLQDNLAAIELTLTQDELMPLDDVSALPQSALYLRPAKPVGVLQRADLRRAAGRVRRRVHRAHAAQQPAPDRGDAGSGGSLARPCRRTGRCDFVPARAVLVHGRQHPRQKARDAGLPRRAADVLAEVQGSRRRRLRRFHPELRLKFRPGGYTWGGDERGYLSPRRNLRPQPDLTEN